MRHAYRSWLDALGIPIALQQKMMRHADIGTTMNIYGVPPQNASDVTNFLADAMAEVRAGKIDPKLGTTLGYLGPRC